MANLIVRRTPGELHHPSAEAERFPWMHWDPFQQMAPFWPGEQAARFTPDFEVKETKEGFLFKADVPGIKEKDLEITMTGNRLTITGKREAETEERTDTYYACERSYGTFTRSFTLPEGTGGGDRIHAELSQGVLTLLVPKKPELQPRRIELKVTDKPKS
jgi:HSP20 family protein